MKTEFVIVDIDGTVADLRHRIHFIQGEKKDWDALVAEVAKATFSTESRVRNLMCVDYYGTPIQDLRKSLKLK